ncbi:hypothetical protein CANCADRAFT_1543 [Tortispora caseinolytica NRRL Y-17796]|uniref:DUF1014-domain-containing protein n=1 Tax=Tortispora caseinolytica NRRL Y-17796 TaxID=767744 RepID=A0A1E4TMH0_9ASCO|nr:hypothetical protein CANCADRAFT_1543 [Tortispora caseinolytica NRRL Y-17796]
MAKKGGENSKKAAGNAKKAEAAAKKQAEQDAKVRAAEDAEWSNGAKGMSKKEAEAQKKAELSRKKAEREAMLAEEEKSMPSKPTNRGSDKIAKKREAKNLASTPGLNKAASISASGIDNALDALSISGIKQAEGASSGPGYASRNPGGIDRHPERRFKAAFAAFEERRLPELKEEHKGLRLNQYKELIRKEFEKSPENPFNQATVAYDATQDEVREVKQAQKAGIEARLRDH